MGLQLVLILLGLHLFELLLDQESLTGFRWSCAWVMKPVYFLSLDWVIEVRNAD